MTAWTRRRYLGLVAGMAAGGAGCLGDGGEGTTTPDGTDPGDRVEHLAVPTMGDPDAPVAVTVFEDFSCPHCQTFEMQVVPQLEAEYVDSGEVSFRRRDFPLPLDDWSWVVPSGMRAVQDEAGDGAFFEAVSEIYPHRGSYSLDVIESVGRTVADVGNAARDAAEHETYRPVVEADRAAGVDAGVPGTPAVFVEGSQTSGYGYETVAAAIDDRL